MSTQFASKLLRSREPSDVVPSVKFPPLLQIWGTRTPTPETLKRPCCSTPTPLNTIRENTGKSTDAFAAQSPEGPVRQRFLLWQAVREPVLLF